MQLVHFQWKVTAYIVSWFEVGQLQKLRRDTKKRFSWIALICAQSSRRAHIPSQAMECLAEFMWGSDRFGTGAGPGEFWIR